MDDLSSRRERDRPNRTNGEAPELDDLSSLIRWTLSLTPLERLDFAQRQANAVLELRANRRVSRAAED